MKNERRAKIIELIGQYPIENAGRACRETGKIGFSRDAGNHIA